ncbi:MAG: energy transducer TonB [Lewinellaceae bacterium]|nr:energy transducer TonB [Lewinellaceae bacterium]
MKQRTFFTRLLAGATLFLLALAPIFAQHSAELPEKMPEYPGGTAALMQYMSDNMAYPAEAKKEKAEGTVFVKFTVNTDGSLSDIKTVSEGAPLRPDMVLEAIRVVKGMPKWAPAQKAGKTVSVEMTLPIVFKLG